MTWDAVVIGAGPAGAVAARGLARSGCSVLLVDKAHFPRPKVCGCCVNGAAIQTLQRLGLGHVLAEGVPLRDVRIGAGRRTATVPLPGGVALSRDALDLALVREAQRAGAELREGVTAKFGAPSLAGACGAGAPPAKAPGPHAPGAEIRLGAERVEARVAVVASGLAGSDTEPAPGSRVGAGAIVPAERVPDFFAPGTIFMATGRGGYVGLVRVEDGRLDVAAAFDVAFVKARGGLGAAADAVLAGVGWPRAPGLAELPWRGTPALTRRARQLAGERWFAIGDAAGYVEPFTGEGMAWAAAAAAAVAPLAARAVQRWDAALAREWGRAYRRAVGERQGVCRAVARVLRSPLLTGAAVRALSAFPALSRPVVSRLNRRAPAPNGTPS
ncbi:MAG: NAD(P)/FAD-dependent oxidoreductase [Gemmata sp.]